jgi:hypothetical protein
MPEKPRFSYGETGKLKARLFLLAYQRFLIIPII